MRSWTARSARCLAAALCLYPVLVWSTSARAQSPIRFIVPAAAGGSIDVYARIVSEPIAARLQRPVVIEARAGANGNIAAQLVADSPADGATVLVGTQSLLEINPAAYKSLRWKPADFVPVIKGIETLLLLVVHPSFPASTFEEWVAHVKANPGKLVYANYGPGTVSHFLGFQVGEQLGLAYTQVPYRGSAPQMIDLLAGHVKFGFTQLQGAVEPVKAGQLRALVLAAPARSPLLPELRSFADVGLAELSATPWFGLLVRSGTPVEVIERLQQAASDVHADAGVRKRLEDQGYIVSGQTGPTFAKSIAEQSVRWTRIVKATGFTAE
jgi:tripartite-type tricarboxylate transporter receptor subunit TctC